MIFAVFLYPPVRLHEGFHQAGFGIATEGLVVNLKHSFDREATGLLTAFITTHAIGNHGQAALALKLFGALRFPIKKRVFVVLALAADISQPATSMPGFVFMLSIAIAKSGACLS